MTKVKPTTKEQLVYFLINNISLGTYDRKFLSNIENMCLVKNKPLTTNQADLLEKIVRRYSRQLAKQEIDLEYALTLSWALQPIESSPKFTETFLLLVDDELILRSPYKSNFLKAFKKLDVFGKWEQEEKIWRIPANTYTLREVTNCIKEHYSKINYSDNLNDLFTEIKHLDDAIWKPTYSYINGNLYVLATNKILDNVLENVKFDLELSTIARLVGFGITIHDSVKEKLKETHTTEEIEFTINIVNKIELHNLNLSDWLVAIKPDAVIFSEFVSSSREYTDSIKNVLKKHNIDILIQTYNNIIDTEKYEYTVMVETGTSLMKSYTYKVSKAIQIVNSTPIRVK